MAPHRKLPCIEYCTSRTVCRSSHIEYQPLYIDERIRNIEIGHIKTTKTFSQKPKTFSQAKEIRKLFLIFLGSIISPGIF